VPILRTLTKPKSNRITVLQKQIKWIEEHYHYPHRGRGNTTGNSNNDSIVVKQLKQELGDLLE
jgi:hypothetical protein